MPVGGFASLVNISATSFPRAMITIALIIAGLAAIILLIIGGIKWITSAGDKSRLESARNTLRVSLSYAPGISRVGTQVAAMVSREPATRRFVTKFR